MLEKHCSAAFCKPICELAVRRANAGRACTATIGARFSERFELLASSVQLTRSPYINIERRSAQRESKDFCRPNGERKRGFFGDNTSDRRPNRLRGNTISPGRSSRFRVSYEDGLRLSFKGRQEVSQ